jgi:hypothetical protein
MDNFAESGFSLVLIAIIRNDGRQAVTVGMCEWRANTVGTAGTLAGDPLPRQLEAGASCKVAFDFLALLLMLRQSGAVSKERKRGISAVVHLGTGGRVRSKPLKIPWRPCFISTRERRSVHPALEPHRSLGLQPGPYRRHQGRERGGLQPGRQDPRHRQCGRRRPALAAGVPGPPLETDFNPHGSSQSRESARRCGLGRSMGTRLPASSLSPATRTRPAHSG